LQAGVALHGIGIRCSAAAPVLAEMNVYINLNVRGATAA
jgi:hypothetical protein